MLLLNENKIDIYSGSLITLTNEIALLYLTGFDEALFNICVTLTRGLKAPTIILCFVHALFYQ